MATGVQRQLLTVAGVLECLTGFALVLASGPTLLILLGAKADAVGLMLGPLAGLALAALGICCWTARTDPNPSGTLKGITFYNTAAGLYLGFLASSGRAFGFVVWLAAVVHLSLAAVHLLKGKPVDDSI